MLEWFDIRAETERAIAWVRTTHPEAAGGDARIEEIVEAWCWTALEGVTERIQDTDLSEYEERAFYERSVTAVSILAGYGIYSYEVLRWAPWRPRIQRLSRSASACPLAQLMGGGSRMAHTTNDRVRFASAAFCSSRSEKLLTSTNMGSGKTWQSSHLRNRLCERNKKIMPNWCENWLSIRSTGQSVQDYIDGWRAASQDPGLAFSLTSFVPMPGGVSGGVWDHDWCVTHWGTKWDADSAEIEILDEHQHHGCIRFGTAWSPPLPVVEALSRHHPELELILDFGDPAMGFAGRLAGSGGVLEHAEVPSGSPFAKWYRDMCDDEDGAG